MRAWVLRDKNGMYVSADLGYARKLSSARLFETEEAAILQSIIRQEEAVEIEVNEVVHGAVLAPLDNPISDETSVRLLEPAAGDGHMRAATIQEEEH